MIQEAKNQAKSPFERVSRIKAAMIGARAMETSALSCADTILSKVQNLEQGPVAKTKGKFPTNIATEIKEDKNVAALVVVQATIIALAGGGVFTHPDICPTDIPAITVWCFTFLSP